MPDDMSENIWRRIARSATLCAAAGATAALLCACAPSSTDLESRHEGVQASTTIGEHPELACRPDRGLLVAPHAPDCSFGRSELKTLDPDQWARLKIEFERKCYQNAERAVRDKLRRLQAANRCEAEPARS
jgi:hypothetical protein